MIFLLLKRSYNFWNNRFWKKQNKNPPPLPPKNGRFCGKITKTFFQLYVKKTWCKYYENLKKKKKKSSIPYPQMAFFAEKSQKNTFFQL